LKKPKLGRKEKTWSKQMDECWRSRCWVTRVSKHHFRDVNGASIMHPSIIIVEAQSDPETSLTSQSFFS